MIGHIVKVHIDRPLGSYHPEHRDLYYEVNYGYIEDTLACDGEEIDAYVLGVDVPITSFQGRVIAVIHRLDDVEDKLVVAPINMHFSDQEIIKMTHFQEQFFQSVIIR
jgi:inorganic pyrophosphatase